MTPSHLHYKRPGLDVVGESFHNDNLARVYAATRGAPTTAVFVPDPTNRKDRNAVAVHIVTARGTVPVGHLPADVAVQLHDEIAALHAAGTLPVAGARVSQFDTGRGTLGYSVHIQGAPTSYAPADKGKGHSLILHLLLGSFILRINVLVISRAKGHYWHA